MAQPQRRPSLDSDIEEDPERGKKVRIMSKLAFSSLHRLLKDTKILPKDQFISKYLYGVIVWTKKSNEIFSRISALAFKKRLNQKLYYTKYLK